MLYLVTLHPNLVTPYNGLQPVVFAESLGDIRSELHADAPFARSSPRCGLRIGPEHFHHQSLLSGLPLDVPVQLADIVERGLVVGEQATV